MLNKAGGSERLTILHIASDNNYLKIVQILVKNKVDLFAKRFDGKTASCLC